MTMPAPRKSRQPAIGRSRGLELPGTAVAWTLPLLIPWLALFDLGFEAPLRAYKVLWAGTAAVASLLGIGIAAAWRARSEERSRRQNVVLWSFLPTAGVLGVATSFLAEGTSFVLLAFLPWLTWLFCTFLLPLWRDDESMVDPREPQTGWKRLLGIRMIYSDRENPAVWVRMRNPIPLSADSGYTPNLGHFWGRLVIVMFLWSLVAGMAVSIVSWVAR